MTSDTPEPVEVAQDVQDAIDKVASLLAQILSGTINVGITEGLALQRALLIIRDAKAWPVVQREVIKELVKTNSAVKTLLRDILRVTP